MDRGGRPIGPIELIIAATALATETTLVTNNVDEFSRIEELTLEDWSVARG